MVAAAAGAISAVASAAGAIGGLTKSGGSSGTTTQNTDPWAPQQPYLMTGFQRADQNLNNSTAVPSPTSFVAGQSAMQSDADKWLYSVGTGTTGQFAPWQDAGKTAAGQVPYYFNNASRAANDGIGTQSGDTGILSDYARTGRLPGQNTTVDPSLASSITQAGQGALGSLAGGANLATAAGMNALNPNGTINAAVNGAGALSASPYLDGQIDAANRDVNRNLTENTLPQIRAAAMASGNANSSREGALEAISTRGAADRMADTSAAMRGAAYSQGASLGAQGYNQGLSTAVGAGTALNSNGAVGGSMLTNQQGMQIGQQQFGVNSQLGAANQAASQNLGFQTNDTAASLAGNAQVGSGINTGLNATSTSQAGQIAGLSAAYGAGTNEQAGAQAGINNTLADYHQQTQGQSDLLDRYWSVVGGSKGTSASGTTSAQPNNGGIGGALSGAIGGGMAGYGLYKNIKGEFGTGGTTTADAGWGPVNQNITYSNDGTPMGQGYYNGSGYI